MGFASKGRWLKSRQETSHSKSKVASSNVVVLNAEMAAIFPNSAAVNKALHSLVDVARKPQAYHGAPQDEQKQRTSEP